MKNNINSYKFCVIFFVYFIKEYTFTRLTVGKIYAGLLIYENWQMNKSTGNKKNLHQLNTVRFYLLIYTTYYSLIYYKILMKLEK